MNRVGFAVSGLTGLGLKPGQPPPVPSPAHANPEKTASIEAKVTLLLMPA